MVTKPLSFHSHVQVSALVRRYAGDDANVPLCRVAPAGSKRPQGPAAPESGGATVNAGTLRLKGMQPQPQCAAEIGKPQAQPLKADTVDSDPLAAPERPPLGVSGKHPLQIASSIQNGRSSSNSNHKTVSNPAKTSVGTSNVNGSGNTNKPTSSCSSSKPPPPPPVSGAEVRARAAGIEAFKAFQQRQQELRRRRRTAAGDHPLIASKGPRAALFVHA